jgi:hypothetical protein
MPASAAERGSAQAHSPIDGRGDGSRSWAFFRRSDRTES